MGHLWLNILHCWKHSFMNYLSAFLVDNGVWGLEECVALEVQFTLSSQADQMNHVQKVNVSLQWLQQELNLMTCRPLDGKCLKLEGINLACHEPLYFFYSLHILSPDCILFLQTIYSQVLSLGGRYKHVQQGKQEQRLVTQTDQEVVSCLNWPFQVVFPLIWFLARLGAKRSIWSLWWDTGASQRTIHPFLN